MAVGGDQVELVGRCRARAFRALSSAAEEAPSSVDGLAGDHLAVGQLDGRGGLAGLLGHWSGRRGPRLRMVGVDARPAASAAPACTPAPRLPRPCRRSHRAVVVAADDLLPGGLAARPRRPRCSSPPCSPPYRWGTCRGICPAIFSKMALSTGKISTSRL